METSQKIFLVINLSCLGDVVLSNALCQNIKLNYPDSKIVFITDESFVDAAKFQKDVDEVYPFDKRGTNRGFLGLIKFTNNFKYKNKIFAAFTIYGNDRGILLSLLLKAKYRISTPKHYTKFLLTNLYEKSNLIRVQDFNGDLLSALTNKDSIKLPVQIKKDENTENLLQKSLKTKYKNNQLIALTLVAEDAIKNMPIDVAISLIKQLNDENKVPILLGIGKFSKEYANKLKNEGCISFLDLIDATSITDLIDILSICNGLISIDTGTFHLGYAIGTPTVGVFYKKDMAEKWGPDESLYKNVRVIYENQTPENIIAAINKLI